MSENEFDFYLTNDPPEAGTPFGGRHAGRNRTNPFDGAVKQSFEQHLVARNEWLEFKCDPDDVRANINRIRSAGQFLKIGTEVRYDKPSGRIAFRGCEYKPRAPRVKKGAVAPDAPPADQPATAGQPAVAGQESPWDWQGAPR